MTSFLLGAATTGNSLFDSWFDNFWLALISKTIVVMLFFLVVPVCAILGFEAVRTVLKWKAGDE